MPMIAILCGVLLTLIGIAGYCHGVMNDKSSLTALIPAAFGTVLETLGALARVKESWRKHLMHAAIVVALLGFILTAGRLMMKFSEITMSAAVVSQLSMAIVCLAFVILAIRSFAEARRQP